MSQSLALGQHGKINVGKLIEELKQYANAASDDNDQLLCSLLTRAVYVIENLETRLAVETKGHTAVINQFADWLSKYETIQVLGAPKPRLQVATQLMAGAFASGVEYTIDHGEKDIPAFLKLADRLIKESEEV